MAVDLRLYGLVDADRVDGDLASAARLAAEGGATLLQYRDKFSCARDMVQRASAIKQALEGTGVPLLINDRIDVAMAAGADGVHVGQSDIDPTDARAMLGPEAIIGLTIKQSQHLRDAPLDQIDYVCIGGVFATQSKDNPDPPVGLDGLSAMISFLRDDLKIQMPAGAIAGITAENIDDVIAAGADGVAIISDLFRKGDILTMARSWRTQIDAALERR